MNRTFYVFELNAANGQRAVGLTENNVAMGIGFIPDHLFPPTNEEEAEIFTKAMFNAFGQPYPLPDEMRERSWM
jgi:hypothetical protein